MSETSAVTFRWISSSSRSTGSVERSRGTEAGVVHAVDLEAAAAALVGERRRTVRLHEVARDRRGFDAVRRRPFASD